MSEEKKSNDAAPAAAEASSKTKPKKAASSANRDKLKKAPWTEARCHKAAGRFTTVAAWQEGAPSSYKAATSRGWLKACTSHMGKGVTNIKSGKNPTTTKPTHKKSA